MEKFRHRLYQLIGFSAFALGQPILEKLGSAPEFFITRRSESLDLILLSIALLVVPPLIFALIEIPFFFVNRKLGRTVHGAFLLILIALALVPVFSSFDIFSGRTAVAVAALVAYTLLVFVFKFPNIQQFCCFLGFFALISGWFFCSRPGIREIVIGEEQEKSAQSEGQARPIPVTLVIFDELPLSGLLDQNLQIDRQRFPNFAALADQSHWFRNATAVSTHTTLAVPAILTGMLPTKDRRYPSLRSHPNNLFTLLTSSHDIHAWESHTQLCPDTVCGRSIPPSMLSERLETLFWDVGAVALNVVVPEGWGIPVPRITMNWGGFWEEKGAKRNRKPDARRGERLKIFRKWIREIGNTQRPVLHFCHHLLPHMPYQFLPSGAQYQVADTPRAYPKEAWLDDTWGREQAYQQFEMQLGATDLLVGEMIKQLKISNLWDQSLVIVTADHGASFEAGTHRRGHATDPYFYEDLLSIPLFVKAPGQISPILDLKPVESVDILPTIADVLGIKTPWAVDGASMLAQTFPERSEKKMVVGEKRLQKRLVEENLSFQAFSFPATEELPRHTLDWKLSFFPHLTQASPYAFSLSMFPGLLGVAPTPNSIEQKHVVELLSPSLTPTIGEGAVVMVNRKASEQPSFFKGNVRLSGENKSPAGLAIAINDRIAAIVPFFSLKGSLAFEAMIPETLFKEGHNSLQFYAVFGATASNLSFEEAILPGISG